MSLKVIAQDETATDIMNQMVQKFRDGNAGMSVSYSVNDDGSYDFHRIAFHFAFPYGADFFFNTSGKVVNIENITVDVLEDDNARNMLGLPDNFMDMFNG